MKSKYKIQKIPTVYKRLVYNMGETGQYKSSEGDVCTMRNKWKQMNKINNFQEKFSSVIKRLALMPTQNVFKNYDRNFTLHTFDN